MRKSPLYTYPRLYLLCLKLLHGKNFSRRYAYMARFVKKGYTVLEPACGVAVFADFLKEPLLYHGFDTNTQFLHYALQKNRRVSYGNVLNKKDYKKADVVVTCDILHHLKPSTRKQFIQNCYFSARKAFIICEPVHPKSEEAGLVNSIKSRIVEWTEQDGTNEVKAHFFPTYNELAYDVSNGFGVIPKTIKRSTRKLGEDLVIVFLKN